MSRRFESRKLTIALSLTALTCLGASQFDRFSWLAPVIPWLPMALALVAVPLIIRSHGRRVALVLASLLIVAAAAMLLPLSGDSEQRSNARWRRSEAQSIVSTLRAVGDRVAALQDLSAGIGAETEAFLRSQTSTGDSLVTRFQCFQHLESVASRVQGGGDLPTGAQIGLQLFDRSGKRLAWAGWPQALYPGDQAFVVSDRSLVYTRQVSLYQILRHMIPLHDASGDRVATVLVDMPLEINYKVNNNFLKSGSFVDDISNHTGDNLRFSYQPTDVNLPRQLDTFCRCRYIQRTS